MRMRKKKNLESRLAGVGDILFIADFADRNFNTAIQKKEYIDLQKWFGNDHPLFLEIGCGKGKFSLEFAQKNPDINLLAVEKSANVIAVGCEAARERGLDNLKFMKCSAEYLEKFLPGGTVEKIFLNFSCPFPKKAYASHRLTHTKFLEIYKRLLKPGASIEQKTDNMHFFEFSIEHLSSAGFRLRNVSLDLQNSDFKDNIETEYEQKFVALGQPIYRLEAYLGGNDD